MVRKFSNSRLKETAFSQYNLRDAYITDMAALVADLRDEALFSNYSLQVLIRIPAVNLEIYSNNVDEYSNFVNTEWINTTESVIPLFNEYRQVLSEHGLTADGENDFMLPLQVILPTKLYLPRDSRIILNEYDCKFNKVAREWQVLGTMQKQLSNGMTYSNVANCVPARQTTYDTSYINQNNVIWFDDYIDEKGYGKDKQIRAQGTIWFINIPIDRNQPIRVMHDTIFEQIPEFPIINEQIQVPYYYDTRSKYIIKPGVGFMVGEEYDILDDNGNPIYVIADQEGNQKQLILKITKTNEYGGILEFKLNIEKGYSLPNNKDLIQIELVKNEHFPAIIDIKTNIMSGSIYNESLSATIVEQPKYLVPYRMEAILIGKKVVMTVTG